MDLPRPRSSDWRAKLSDVPDNLSQLCQHFEQLWFEMSAGHDVVAQTQPPSLNCVDYLTREN